jgi:hypothetical protein
MPIDPSGQVVSAPNVHFCEHTGWPAMSIVPVQTPLSHSPDESLGVAHAAPKLRGGGPPASGPGPGESLEQAATVSETASERAARRRRCMLVDGTMGALSDFRR